jgi:hypothetical protein
MEASHDQFSQEDLKDAASTVPSLAARGQLDMKVHRAKSLNGSPLFIRALVHTVAQHLRENNVLVHRHLLCKWTYATWLLDCDTSVLRTSQQLNLDA